MIMLMLIFSLSYRYPVCVVSSIILYSLFVGLTHIIILCSMKQTDRNILNKNEINVFFQRFHKYIKQKKGEFPIMQNKKNKKNYTHEI